MPAFISAAVPRSATAPFLTRYATTLLPSTSKRLQVTRRFPANLRVVRASSATPTPDDAISSVPPSISETGSRRLVLTRSMVFVGMSLTYAAYVFLRSTFTYVAPVMAKSLSMSLLQVGKITSAFPLAYGASRLLTGVIVDRALPHQALCLGLLLAGLINAAMGMTTSVPLLTVMWALNGLVQGVGAGASAKMLTAWFPPALRGRYWALWSTSANVGAFFAPVVCAHLAATSGFRAGLLAPGIATAAWAFLLLPLLKSSPSQAGLRAPWETASKQPPQSEGGSKHKSGELRNKAEWQSILVDGVLRNRTIWALAAAYLFVYLVRSGTKSWLHFWLVEARGCSPADAAYRASGMEVGGIVGTFSAGIVSDAVGGRRVVVTLIYLALVAVSLAGMWALPVSIPSAVGFATFAAVGFAINGPQMMIGLIGAEACDRRVVATATGILGWISYLGAAASGFPLSLAIRNGGWPVYFSILIASCFGAIVCLVPLWRLRATQPKR